LRRANRPILQKHFPNQRVVGYQPSTKNYQPIYDRDQRLIRTAQQRTTAASKKVFVEGSLHQDIRVPMREIEVSDTKSYTGAIEKNAPVRVYDCSGPWGDPAFTGTSDEGLPALRREWILKRGDVEEYDGREVKPQDNGYLSGKHAEFASVAERTAS